jgi:hypothetical protein
MNDLLLDDLLEMIRAKIRLEQLSGQIVGYRMEDKSGVGCGTAF